MHSCHGSVVWPPEALGTLLFSMPRVDATAAAAPPSGHWGTIRREQPQPRNQDLGKPICILTQCNLVFLMAPCTCSGLREMRGQEGTNGSERGLILVWTGWMCFGPGPHACATPSWHWFPGSGRLRGGRGWEPGGVQCSSCIPSHKEIFQNLEVWLLLSCVAVLSDR